MSALGCNIDAPDCNIADVRFHFYCTLCCARLLFNAINETNPTILNFVEQQCSNPKDKIVPTRFRRNQIKTTRFAHTHRISLLWHFTTLSTKVYSHCLKSR